MAFDSPLCLLIKSSWQEGGYGAGLSSFYLFLLLSSFSFIQSVHSSSHLCDHYCRLRNFGLKLKCGKPVKTSTM
ncbi:hypothetical protein K438DRAFT_1829021 [Mycena galopus ATCC 62051]|nr:hypothetical protein K438DRAFT_1829021 [Mycena galopus ATCC 62051]